MGYIIAAAVVLLLGILIANGERYPYKCTSPDGGSCVCTALDSLDCD